MYISEASSHNSSKKSNIWIDISILVILIAFFVYFLTASIIWLDDVSSSQSKEVDSDSLSYANMLDMLVNGEDFRIQANLRYMNLDQLPAGQMLTHSDQVAFNIEYYQNFGRDSIGNPKAIIVTSYSIYLVHPMLGTIYEYGKLRVYEDEMYEIVIDFIKADDFTIIQSERFTGRLGAADKGLKVFKHTPKFKKYF